MGFAKASSRKKNQGEQLRGKREKEETNRDLDKNASKITRLLSSVQLRRRGGGQ